MNYAHLMYQLALSYTDPFSSNLALLYNVSFHVHSYSVHYTIAEVHIKYTKYASIVQTIRNIYTNSFQARVSVPFSIKSNDLAVGDAKLIEQDSTVSSSPASPNALKVLLLLRSSTHY